MGDERLLHNPIFPVIPILLTDKVIVKVRKKLDLILEQNTMKIHWPQAAWGKVEN
jgi:hypothetical protein